MIKIMMKRVPRKADVKMNHEVFQRWSSAVVELHYPKEGITVIRGAEIGTNKLHYVQGIQKQKNSIKK